MAHKYSGLLATQPCLIFCWCSYWLCEVSENLAPILHSWRDRSRLPRRSGSCHVQLCPARVYRLVCTVLINSSFEGIQGHAIPVHAVAFLSSGGSQPLPAVKKGERIAQLILECIFTPLVEEVGSLSDTSRGEGGFGSTGTN